MTARKLTSAFLFPLALLSALALSGCGYLAPEGSTQPEQPTPPPPRPPQASAAQPQPPVREPAARPVSDMDISDARKAAEAARKKADALKKTADTMAGQTRSQGKNPEIEAEAPITYAAIQKYRKADEEAQQKEATHRDLVARQQSADQPSTTEQLSPAAEGRTNATATPPTEPAKNRPDVEPTVSPSGGLVDDIMAMLPQALAALAALAILGTLFWWTWEKINGVEALIDGRLRTLSQKQEEQFKELSASVSGVKDVGGHLITLRESLSRLSHSVDGVRKEQLLQSRGGPPPGTPPAAPGLHDTRGEDGHGEQESINFPIPANRFLMSLSGRHQVVKPDPLKGILVKDPEGRGQFALVIDRSVPNGQFCIVPRTARFQASEDFYNHYEHYYECARPGAGEVWVNLPAVVQSVDGGWKLLEKGELEVRT